MTGFNPLCFSICGKDEPFCTSLIVRFSLEKIIYHICDGKKAKYKWQDMLIGQGPYHIPHNLKEQLGTSQQLR
jgi:hypothetical protein